MSAHDHDWIREFPYPITVTDQDGIVLAMNDASADQYAGSGGRALIGSNCLDCHPEPARSVFAGLLRSPRPNVYTIEKHGRRRLVIQSPWYREGIYAGYVETIVDLPDDMPHHVCG